MGENVTPAIADVFKKLNNAVAIAIKTAPVYKVGLASDILDIGLTVSQWFTAFPQIVSRVGHKNDEVYGALSTLIVTVMQQYPKQALWLFTSVVKSTKRHREQRGRQILEQLRVRALVFVK
jgi:serine/threonine-protein kinase ATR